MIPSLRWRENQVIWTFTQRTCDSVRLLFKYNQRMLVVEELAFRHIHILNSSGAGLMTTRCQIKKKCIQLPVNISYCPNFPEPCTPLINLVNSYCSLFQARSNPACLIPRVVISTFLSSFPSLAGSSNCLAHIYGCLDICFCQAKRGLLNYYHSPRESCSWVKMFLLNVLVDITWKYFMVESGISLGEIYFYLNLRCQHHQVFYH